MPLGIVPSTDKYTIPHVAYPMSVVIANSTYDAARDVISDGDIVFIHGTDTILRKIVTAVTDSEFPHVVIAFWAEIGGTRKLMCVEAIAGSKRRIVNLSYYSECHLTVIKAPAPWSSVMPFAFKRLGIAQYGWIGAFYIGLREVILRNTGILLKARNTPHEVCSEFIAQVYHIPDTCVSPQKLFEKLTEPS